MPNEKRELVNTFSEKKKKVVKLVKYSYSNVGTGTLGELGVFESRS